MARLAPYLQRRGDMLFFRLAVPPDLRPIVGGREITKTLRTTDKCIALPLALEYAACAKRMFSELRAGIELVDEQKLKLVAQIARQKIQKSDQDEELQRREEGHAAELRRVRVEADRRVAEERLKAENEALRLAMARFPVAPSATTPAPPPSPPAIPVSLSASPPGPAAPAISGPAPTSPQLSELIRIFLEREGKRDIGPMMKKHSAVLPMFLEFVGNKPVSLLRQKSDIADFLEMVMRLPPRWKDIHDKQKLSARQIAEQNHPVTIAEGTYTGTYRASVSMFLDWAMTTYQDEGFPTSLTVSKIGYHGARKKGTQQKQRALTLDELKRLFEGAEMAAIAADSTRPGLFWLPHVLLFTGARINEICQVNPQTDICKDPTGFWFIRITEEEGDEDDEGVTRSVKTGTTREVPIHYALTELGFIKYVERVKAAGAKVLFPEWKPRAGRASVNAERWFNRHLREIGLHGVKNAKGHAIRGAHAFRHNLLTYGRKQGLNLRPISGHVEKSDNKVADGYEDETIIAPLDEKRRRLDQLDFGIKFFSPAEPRPTKIV